MSGHKFRNLLGAGLVLCTALYAFFQDNRFWYVLPLGVALLWLIDMQRSRSHVNNPDNNATPAAFDRGQQLSTMVGASGYVCALREVEKHRLVLTYGHIIRREYQGMHEIWIVDPRFVPDQPGSQLIEIRFTGNSISGNIGGGLVDVSMLENPEVAAGAFAMQVVHELAMEFYQS
jgi:hypothetical protein